MSRELPKVGGVFLQAESEVSAINMVYGAGGAGARVMTSSSSPGIALKQEGISYLAGAEVPCFISSISRSGPGLGGILPSQADYFQATRGGGNGDYRTPVYAPANLQELSDLTQKSFHIADKYRTPVMLLADGMLAQMMEPVEIKDFDFEKIEPTWATTTTQGKRERNIVNSLNLTAQGLENHNRDLQAKYNEIEKNEVMYELYNCENAEVVVVAYGSASRIVKNAIDHLKEEGINAGMLRPITLWPFPYKAFDELPTTTKKLLSAEFSMGQMIDDVKIASFGRWPVDFYGRTGGAMFSSEEIMDKVKEMMEVE
jgi:2-oxoglutarate ferredoxin oxidoreductase subunit alpha